MLIRPCRPVFVESAWSWNPHDTAVENALVSFVWPGWMRPTALIGGQLVCSGCGSESISCDRVSALMNVTLCPTAIVTVFGSTVPPARMVIVAPLGPGAPVSGVSGFLLPLPPQFANAIERRKREKTQNTDEDA
jgi:hypothetical protein